MFFHHLTFHSIVLLMNYCYAEGNYSTYEALYTHVYFITSFITTLL